MHEPVEQEYESSLLHHYLVSANMSDYLLTFLLKLQKEIAL
jgi:hypothetical protein